MSKSVEFVCGPADPYRAALLAAVAKSKADIASYLRKHIFYDACNVRSMVGWRTFAMLRGIRGVEGAAWGLGCLLQPSLCDVLEDTRLPAAAIMLQEIARFLLAQHELEEQRLVLAGAAPVLAAKFSQHHEGRRAGQSGRHWLLAAASVGGAHKFATGLAMATDVLAARVV